MKDVNHYKNHSHNEFLSLYFANWKYGSTYTCGDSLSYGQHEQKVERKESSSQLGRVMINTMK